MKLNNISYNNNLLKVCVSVRLYYMHSLIVKFILISKWICRKKSADYHDNNNLKYHD